MTAERNWDITSATTKRSLTITIQEITYHAEPRCHRCAPRRYSRAFFPASLSRRACGRGAALQCGISRGGGRFLYQDGDALPGTASVPGRRLEEADRGYGRAGHRRAGDVAHWTNGALGRRRCLSQTG